MKTYTIYDNADGGYTIWYQFFDNSNKNFVRKFFQANTKALMLDFAKKLQKNGYKFVGKM